MVFSNVPALAHGKTVHPFLLLLPQRYGYCKGPRQGTLLLLGTKMLFRGLCAALLLFQTGSPCLCKAIPAQGAGGFLLERVGTRVV